MAIRILGAYVGLIVIAAGCAAPQPTTSSPPSSAGIAALKHITAAMSGEPPAMSYKLSPPGVAGVLALEKLVNVGLSVQDETNAYRPRLAEALPSVENGLWQVSPDGTMETTWHIVDGARWHDDTALSADDLLFTVAVS